MANLTRDIAAGADNGYGYFGTTSGYNNNQTIILGHLEVLEYGINVAHDGVFRFTNITVPVGAKITNATFTAYIEFNEGVDTDIQAFDEDNSSQVTDLSNLEGRSRTTALVRWQPSGTDDKVSGSIASIIQEIVDRGDWTSGDAIQLVISDHTYKYPNTPSDELSANVTNLDSHLYIEYIVAPTVSTTAATVVDVSTATLNGEITATGGENNTIRGFQYGLTDAYGTDIHEDGSYGTGTYALAILSLSPGTPYHFRAYSVNSAGTGYGADATLITLPSVEERVGISRLVYDDMMAYMMEDY